MREEISSGIVVFREEKGTREYLLLSRREKFLDFPKGHIEEGENEETAAERETLEETGLQVRPIQGFRKETTYWFRAPASTEEEKEKSVSQYAKKRANRELIHKKLVMFLGRAPENKEPEVSIEHTGYQWLDYETCISMLRYDNQRELLGEAEQFLSGHGKEE